MKARFIIGAMLVLASIAVFRNQSSAYMGESLSALSLLGSPDTDVGGIISTDTTWGPASSPYNLVSEVQVAPGVTLTIEPGVVVKGNGRTIRVFGTLNAVGSDSSRIAFSDTKIAPGSGTAGGSQYLIRIEFAVIDGGSVYEATGYAIYGSLRLTDSVIRNLTQPMYIWYPTADCFLEKNIFYQSKGISIGIQTR